MTSEDGLAGWSGFWEAGQTVSWGEMMQSSAKLRGRLHQERPAAVVAPVPAGLALVTMLLAVRDTDIAVLIAGSNIPDSTVARVGADIIAEWVGSEGSFTVRRLSDPPGRKQGTGRSGLWLLSAGTTGEPKPFFWPWDNLAPSVEWGRGNEHWAIGYAPHSFACVSATCEALGRASSVEFVRSTDLVSPAPDAVRLTVAAATPSFWRLAAVAGDARSFRRVETVTVGGEMVDQSFLDLMREIVAPDRIKQIFGATEVGTPIHVDDGLPGLPENLRGRRLPGGGAFDVQEDLLVISPRPGAPYTETGDLVRFADGRVHVVGRVGIHVNVGGMKANPYRVAQLLQEHDSVLAARAYGIRSALLGQVVAADVVARGGSDPSWLVADLKRYSGARLDTHERPQRIRVVESLAVAESGKVQM